jgi:hypothetical protein
MQCTNSTKESRRAKDYWDITPGREGQWWLIMALLPISKRSFKKNKENHCQFCKESIENMTCALPFSMT